MRISRPLLDAILAQAAANPDREICGLLFGSETCIDAALPTTNVHPEPARHFEVDPTALIAAHRAERAGGRRLIGHYHSHPTGIALPSDEDVRSGEPGRLSLIVGGGEARLYRTLDTGFEEVVLTPILQKIAEPS